MSAEIFTRGNIVEFSITFKDADDETITPVGDVTLRVDFATGPETDDRTDEEIAMGSDTAGNSTAEWDSSDAYPGRVFWSATSASPVATVDGYFDLAGNRANLNVST